MRPNRRAAVANEGLDRRAWLLRAGGMALGTLLPGGCAPRVVPPTAETDPVLRFPEKIPLRVLNTRPPCLETPFREFRTDLTPNEAFFVRWHLQAIPTRIDLASWRLKVVGHVNQTVELSLDDLRRLESASVVAVNQCSGNSRALFGPRVTGAQWGNGAMGNARWTGVPLRALLRRAGLKAGARQVTFLGLDKGPLPSVPDFVKALDVGHCEQPDVLVAYAMNDAPLPLLNGFPVRLVVPGWYATYWVKALATITVLPHVFDGYWMAKAYKIPPTENAVEDPNDLAKNPVPISRMNVRSFFTTPDPDATLPVGRPCSVDGIAFDGGSGIRQVDVSADGGRTWQPTELGQDLGPYSFRRWRWTWTPAERGDIRLQARATSRDGAKQPATAGWNRGGYMRNVIEALPVKVI